VDIIQREDAHKKIMREHTYNWNNKALTVFIETDDRQVELKSLMGVECGNCGDINLSDAMAGMILLGTSMGRFEGCDLELTESEFNEDSVRLLWQISKGALQVESNWKFCADTGICRRKDRLTNIGKTDIRINRCLARFTFTLGNYEVYSQDSRWCNENQGMWRNLDHGSIVLACDGGRTTQGGTPYACLRPVENADWGVGFHVIPQGNWIIRMRTQEGDGDPSFVIVELGLADEDLNLLLQAGTSVDLPEILLQPVRQGQVHLSTADLHKYLLANQLPSQKGPTPIVYNTWLDNFDDLDVDRLRRQLKTAKEIGCEVFTVDAGWFGTGDGPWYKQVGDWREKNSGAFNGRMAEFANEVRDAGLGFGLWKEAERLVASVPIVQEHPDWFFKANDSLRYPNLTNPKAFDYVYSETSRLIETYQVSWMKLDFNMVFGVDPLGTEFFAYYEQLYRLLDKLRDTYPDVFWEGCSGGGLRLDLNTLSHFSGHFLSDASNPIDMIRILQGAMLRVPIGGLTKWLACRSIRNILPNVSDGSEQLLVPCGGGWDRAETAGIDFVARATMPGIFGLSGDISSFSDGVLQRLRNHIDFYKEWRTSITESVTHLLTKPKRRDDRSGWVAMQLETPKTSTSLVFVYRLDDVSHHRHFALQGLEPSRKYQVKNSDSPDDEPLILSGAQLADGGLEVNLQKRLSAAVFIVSTCD
jgi:alpha-galactosidase